MAWKPPVTVVFPRDVPCEVRKPVIGRVNSSLVTA